MTGAFVAADDTLSSSGPSAEPAEGALTGDDTSFSGALLLSGRDSGFAGDGFVLVFASAVSLSWVAFFLSSTGLLAAFAAADLFAPGFVFIVVTFFTIFLTVLFVGGVAGVDELFKSANISSVAVVVATTPSDVPEGPAAACTFAPDAVGGLGEVVTVEVVLLLGDGGRVGLGLVEVGDASDIPPVLLSPVLRSCPADASGSALVAEGASSVGC
mmetsp:Transcript_639/g.2338  ORF Transcript_639/g.2338 Transcript_639/m.2338 type:complete len:214 (-) Transcript_639:254-895(-)